MGISLWQVLIVLAIVILLFGTSKLRNVGSDLGSALKGFKKAIQDDGLTWNHVSHIKYFQDPIAQLYNVDAIPAEFLLDENGVIVAKNLRGSALEAKVAELLD